jgi:hypothetical protein
MKQRHLYGLVILIVIIVVMVAIHFYTAPKQIQVVKLDNLITTPRAKVNIILATIPKSASRYIYTMLEYGLGCERMTTSPGYFPIDNLSYTELDNFYAQQCSITKNHFNASVFNIQLLKKYTNQIVLQLRDPREVLLSWAHYIQRIHDEDKIEYLYHVAPTPPPEYYQWQLTQQIDWNIDNFLPHAVAWMEEWIKFKDEEDKKLNGFKVLLTTYDEFKLNELAFYLDILKFYNIPSSQFSLVPQPLDMNMHFRKGDQNEWRQVFTPEQKIRIANIVPSSLLKRFNWHE